MPLVASASGWPQSVSSRSRCARSSTGVRYQSWSPSLIRWHWHFAAAPRPNTAWRSSQLAWLAGNTDTSNSAMGRA